jgi:hypothetical protein
MSAPSVEPFSTETPGDFSSSFSNSYDPVFFGPTPPPEPDPAPVNPTTGTNQCFTSEQWERHHPRYPWTRGAPSNPPIL